MRYDYEVKLVFKGDIQSGFLPEFVYKYCAVLRTLKTPDNIIEIEKAKTWLKRWVR